MTNRRFYYYKGRVAFYAILEAAGIGPGDLVIVPAYTCIVVPLAIMHIGATPVYVDIDRTTYNLSPNRLSDTLDEHPNADRIRAIIAQHTYGIPCEMDEILKAASARDIIVIEDSCHALGSRYRGRQTGTMGAAAFYSSQWSKPVTTGLGGWAVGNTATMYERLRSGYMRYDTPSYIDSSRISLQKFVFDAVYRPRLAWVAQSTYRWLARTGLMIGSSTDAELEGSLPTHFLRRMAPRQQRQLEDRLARLNTSIASRRSCSSLIENSLVSAGLPTLALPTYMDPVLLRYPISVRDKTKALTTARAQLVELGDWFLSPVHPNLTNWSRVGYSRGSCPVAESVCAETVNIPTHDRTSAESISRTVELLAKFKP